MKSILFTEANTHATIEGIKKNTRRIIKPQPDNNGLHDHTKFPMTIHPDYDMTGFWGTVEETDEIKQFIPRHKVDDICFISEPYRIIGGSLGIYDFEFAYSKCTKSINIMDYYSTEKAADWIEKRFKEQKKSRTGFCNKMFMPEFLAQHFIKITAVRAERLQDISDEECMKEGIENWLEAWVIQNYPDFECQHWIVDGVNDGDQSISYCRKCCEKEVKKLQKKAIKQGHSKQEAEDDISVDGGWGQESSSQPFCEICGKPLQYDFCGNLSYELEYYMDFNVKFDKYLAHLIDNGYVEDCLAVKGFPRRAYAAEIDAINGKGTWAENPYVWVYDYELIKK